MNTIVRRLSALLLVLAICPIAAQAVPIAYRFSTGDAQPGHPTLAPLFAGLSVNGTFDYDPAAAAGGTVPAPFVTEGATAYPGSITSLAGAVGGDSFFDPIGGTIVGDDKFQNSTPFTDILVLRADPGIDAPIPLPHDLIGFEIDGYTLVNVRLFWIEDLIGGAPDFLSDQSLPGMLPGFVGRLALDFTPTDEPGLVSSVFFDDLIVTKVAEPASLSLLAFGLAGVAVSRRRKRGCKQT